MRREEEKLRKEISKIEDPEDLLIEIHTAIQRDPRLRDGRSSEPAWFNLDLGNLARLTPYDRVEALQAALIAVRQRQSPVDSFRGAIEAAHAHAEDELLAEGNRITANAGRLILEFKRYRESRMPSRLKRLISPAARKQAKNVRLERLNSDELVRKIHSAINEHGYLRKRKWLWDGFDIREAAEFNRILPFVRTLPRVDRRRILRKILVATQRGACPVHILKAIKIWHEKISPITSH